MDYQITPEDEKTLNFLVGSNPAGGPMRQFLDMSANRGSIEPPSSTVDRFSMGGQLDPRTLALLTRLAQMRQPIQTIDANEVGKY